MGKIKMGRLTVVATQPPTFRGFFRIDGLNLVVLNDSELVEDLDYAPGVFESLQEAWDNGDYFVVEHSDDDGTLIDSLSSMAGYGGPRKAAEAFAQDHAVKTNPGRTSGQKRRWATGGLIHRYTAKGFSREDTGGNCDAWARLGGRGEPHLMVTCADEQSAPVQEHRPVTLSIMRAMTGNEEDILYSRDYASSDRFLRALGDLSNAEMVGTFDITG